MTELDLRRDLCRWAKRAWDRGLIGATEGNLSCRLSEDQILITPAGAIKADVECEDLVVANLSGEPLDGKEASSEVLLHCSVYQERPDAGAVVHAHPPFATGTALAGRAIPMGVLPEADVYLGPIAVVPFAIPGTEEVGAAVRPHLKDHKAILLMNHGALTFGRTPGDAFCYMETLERVATIYWVAETLGKAQGLPDFGAAWARARSSGGRI